MARKKSLKRYQRQMRQSYLQDTLVEVARLEGQRGLLTQEQRDAFYGEGYLSPEEKLDKLLAPEPETEPIPQPEKDPQFITSTKMDEDTFWKRFYGARRAITIEKGPGRVDVLDASTNEHIARWVLGVLYFNPPKPQAPVCPKCGRVMELNQSRKDMSFFWGCPNYHVNGCGETVDASPKSQAERDALQALLVEQQQDRTPARKRREQARSTRVLMSENLIL